MDQLSQKAFSGANFEPVGLIFELMNKEKRIKPINAFIPRLSILLGWPKSLLVFFP